MDRLRVMSGARRLFNGSFQKCSKTANHRTSPSSWLSSPSLSLEHGRYVAVRMFASSSPTTGSIILESPFGPVNTVDLTLPDYIWKNVENWEDKPMIVSHLLYVHRNVNCVSNYLSISFFTRSNNRRFFLYFYTHLNHL